MQKGRGFLRQYRAAYVYAVVMNAVAPPPASTAELVVYDEGLANGFHFHYWSAPAGEWIDFQYNGDAYTGNYSMRLALSGWATAMLTYERGEEERFFTPQQYNTLQFYVKGLQPAGKPFNISLMSNHYTVLATISTAPWLPAGAPPKWTRVTIPLTAFETVLPQQPLSGIMIDDRPPHDGYGDLLFDDIRFCWLPDTVGPSVLSARNVGLTEVRIQFDERLAEKSVVPSAFSLTSATDPRYLSSRAPNKVTVVPQSLGRTVALTVPDSLVTGAVYRIAITGLTDTLGNEAAGGTAAVVTVTQKRVTCTIDAATDVRPFKPGIRGGGFGSWTFGWERPYLNQLPGLIKLAKAIKPGVLRFAGGLAVNQMEWSRDNGRRVTEHLYRADEIDGLAAFADSVGAEVMIQVNLADNNPSQWADMVRYCNVEKGHHFKYWEFGNEWDLLGASAPGTPEQYAQWFVQYRRAMLSVDSTIRFCGPVTANFGASRHERPWYKPLIDACAADGKPLDVLTWHWYQTFGGADINMGTLPDVLFNYSTALQTYDDHMGHYPRGSWVPDGSWLLKHRRRFVEYSLNVVENEILPNNSTTLRAITEIGTYAGGSGDNVPMRTNFVAALWAGDILGRCAYHGLDMACFWLLYEEMAGEWSGYGVIQPDNVYEPSRFIISPVYYTYFMYAQYFGDMMVQASSSDYPLPYTNDATKPALVSVWASRHSGNPEKLSLICPNLSADYCTVEFDVSGFSPAAGEYYELTNPTPLSSGEQYNAYTEINGRSISGIPSQIEQSIAAIRPRSLAVGRSFSHLLPPHSITAITLHTAKGNAGVRSSPSPAGAAPLVRLGLPPAGSRRPVRITVEGGERGYIDIFSASGRRVFGVAVDSDVQSVQWRGESGMFVVRFKTADGRRSMARAVTIR